MQRATDRLLSQIDARRLHEHDARELLPVQLAAANERLEAQAPRIGLLANRLETAGIAKVCAPDDLVPLLFAHGAYKTYPERWLTEGAWQRMNRWLEAVSTLSVGALDLDGVVTLDDWVKRLERAGHFLACSSGTSGKPALISATARDLELAGQMQVAACSWATGIEPGSARRFFGLGAKMDLPKNEAIRQAMMAAFSSEHEPFVFPMPPITIGSITRMIVLRRRLSEGTASPSEIEELQRVSAEREAAMAAGLARTAEALVESRALPIFALGMVAALYSVCRALREQGVGGEDFHPDNALIMAGGLKGVALPPDYREFILETLHVADERVFQFYSMQEIASPLPLCRSGRYHVPPWILMLPLDASGEQLLDPGDEEIEARAGFFDASLEGRWGGVISGDRVRVAFTRCACGDNGPTIAREIERYADLPGGDKIACAGNIDAYVRGVT